MEDKQRADSTDELCLCQIVIEIQANWWKMIVLIQFKLIKLFTLILNSILFQSLGHVQVPSIELPCVACSM